jgi:hypothetical protein
MKETEELSRPIDERDILHSDWQPPFITECGGCKKDMNLLKDDTQGMQVFCADCWRER